MIVVFDLDDTLYPERLYVESGFRAVARHVAGEWSVSESEALRVLRRSLRETGRGRQFDDLVLHFGRRASVRRLVEIYRRHEPTITLPKSTANVFDRLGDRPLYLVTDGHKGVQNAKVEALGLRARFRHCYLTNRYGTPKPSPRVFELIATRESCAPASVVYIGDDPSKDFRGIRPLGFRTIRVRTGRHADVRVAKKHDAETSVKKLSEVVPIVQAFEKEIGK